MLILQEELEQLLAVIQGEKGFKCIRRLPDSIHLKRGNFHLIFLIKPKKNANVLELDVKAHSDQPNQTTNGPRHRSVELEGADIQEFTDILVRVYSYKKEANSPQIIHQKKKRGAKDKHINCPYCKDKFKSEAFVTHLQEMHPEKYAQFYG